jgi:RNA polymerase sigma factor (sigma-70 family)
VGEVGALRPDTELVAACLRGEQAAWDALVDRYSALIYSIPLKYGLSEADAADVFQSVCLTLLEKLGSLREPRGLSAWIVTTTTRACWAAGRKHSQSERTQAGLNELDLPDPLPLPEDEILALERARQVRLAVEHLPPRCRELVQALFGESESNASYRDLAARLGMPVNSVGPTRARCLARLRRLLAEVGYVARG